jgi:hypothetical protein
LWGKCLALETLPKTHPKKKKRRKKPEEFCFLGYGEGLCLCLVMYFDDTFAPEQNLRIVNGLRIAKGF